MSLELWKWNLGAAVVVLGGCGGAASEESCDYDTDGIRAECAEESGWYAYGSGYDEHDDPTPECRDDLDCAAGYCANSGFDDARCVKYPAIPACEEQAPVSLTWMRQGEAAGRAVGVIGEDAQPQQVLIEDADDVPLGIATAEADALVQPLPIELGADERAVGLEALDLDGDEEDELLVTVRGETRTRVVPLDLDAGAFLPLQEVEFYEPGGPARVRIDAQGTATLYVLGTSGTLHQATQRTDGSFSAPLASPWGDAVVYDFVVGPISDGGKDDVVVLVHEDGTSQGVVEGLLDGLRVSFGVSGNRTRTLHADPLRGHLVTTLTTTAGGEFERFFVGPNASGEAFSVDTGAGSLQSSAMTDLDGDGQGDLVLRYMQPALQVVFAVSTPQACVQTIQVPGRLDTLLAPASGTGRGVIATGPGGVLALRGASG